MKVWSLLWQKAKPAILLTTRKTSERVGDEKVKEEGEEEVRYQKRNLCPDGKTKRVRIHAQRVHGLVKIVSLRGIARVVRGEKKIKESSSPHTHTHIYYIFYHSSSL